MKCPKCGAEVTGKYCSYCGSELPYNGPQSVNSGNSTVNSNNVTHNVTNIYYVNQAPETADNRNRPSSEYASQSVNNQFTGNPAVSDKNKSTMMILCFLFGIFGVHHFYAGRWKMGLLYLFTGGIVGIGYIVDFIMIAANKYKDANGLPVVGTAVWGKRIVFLVLTLLGFTAFVSSDTSDGQMITFLFTIVFGILFVISLFRKK